MPFIKIPTPIIFVMNSAFFIVYDLEYLKNHGTDFIESNANLLFDKIIISPININTIPKIIVDIPKSIFPLNLID